MLAWPSAYGGAAETSERALNKFRGRYWCSVHAYPSDMITHDSCCERIILKGSHQLLERASARTLAFLCSNPPSFGNDLDNSPP